MNELRKQNIKATLKYTWPFYILSGLVLGVAIYFIFGLTHRTPTYKTLTLFVSGEVNDPETLKKDMLNRFKDNDLKTFSCISARPTDTNYYQKLSVPGYNTADVLIVTESKLNDLVVSAFGMELKDELISSYYQDMSIYSQDEIKYGIKIDREKVKQYMTLPNEDCYMILNGKSVNTGKYSPKEIKEHDNALQIVKDWGM